MMARGIVILQPLDINKNVSCRRETARCLVSDENVLTLIRLKVDGNHVTSIYITHIL